MRDVVGDDSLFPDQRWSPGMSWNNIPTRSGTGISALTLDDNELPMQRLAGGAGQPPTLELLPYYSVDNRAVTVAAGTTDLDFDRLPGSRRAAPDRHDRRRRRARACSASASTIRPIMPPGGCKPLLEARGVRVTGEVAARHRPLRPADDPPIRNGAPPRPSRRRPTRSRG